jgi:hypothetical protein
MKVPALAKWLLVRLVPSAQSDTIAGDLDEQFASGRSRFWYWRQALNTVLVQGLGEIRSSKLMTVLAVLVGWLSIFAFHAIVVNQTMLLQWSRQSGLVGLTITYLSAVIAGYTVVRLGRRFSMVLPFVISIWLLSLVWVGFTIAGVTEVRIQQPRDLAIAVAVQFFLMPIGILLGGVTATPRGRHPEEESG